MPSRRAERQTQSSAVPVDKREIFSDAARLDNLAVAEQDRVVNRFLRFVTSLVLVMTLPGCTYRLWETEQFRSFRYPSPDPKLVVLHDRERDDFIACYDELSDNKGTVQRRAYFVRANSDVTERGHKPSFVEITPTNYAAFPTNPRGAVPPFVTETNAVFTIHATNELVGPARLPTYRERSGVPTKIALTPLTVIADVAAGGIVVGILFPDLWIGHASH